MLIVEVDVKNGLPGTKWYIKQEPRYLLAVVHGLKEFQRDRCQKNHLFRPNTGKFAAKWEDGYVKLEVPMIDGDFEVFLFVLIQTLESMAKSLLEIKWGGMFLDAMLNQGQITVPKIGRKLVV